MVDLVAASDRIVDAFNDKDFESLRNMMHPKLKLDTSKNRWI